MTFVNAILFMMFAPLVVLLIVLVIVVSLVRVWLGRKILACLLGR